MEEEEPSYGVYDLKVSSSLEGGPYRRHGISLVNLPTVDSVFVPAETELDKESWMYKCALSAAEFNHRYELFWIRFHLYNSNGQSLLRDPLIAQPQPLNRD